MGGGPITSFCMKLRQASQVATPGMRLTASMARRQLRSMPAIAVHLPPVMNEGLGFYGLKFRGLDVSGQNDVVMSKAAAVARSCAPAGSTAGPHSAAPGADAQGTLALPPTFPTSPQ